MNYKNLITIYFALNVTEGLFSNRFYTSIVAIVPPSTLTFENFSHTTISIKGLACRQADGND